MKKTFLLTALMTSATFVNIYAADLTSTQQLVVASQSELQTVAPTASLTPAQRLKLKIGAKREKVTDVIESMKKEALDEQKTDPLGFLAKRSALTKLLLQFSENARTSFEGSDTIHIADVAMKLVENISELDTAILTETSEISYLLTEIAKLRKEPEELGEVDFTFLQSANRKVSRSESELSVKDWELTAEPLLVSTLGLNKAAKQSDWDRLWRAVGMLPALRADRIGKIQDKDVFNITTPVFEGWCVISPFTGGRSTTFVTKGLKITNVFAKGKPMVAKRNLSGMELTEYPQTRDLRTAHPKTFLISDDVSKEIARITVNKESLAEFSKEDWITVLAVTDMEDKLSKDLEGAITKRFEALDILLKISRNIRTALIDRGYYDGKFYHVEGAPTFDVHVKSSDAGLRLKPMIDAYPEFSDLVTKASSLEDFKETFKEMYKAGMLKYHPDKSSTVALSEENKKQYARMFAILTVANEIVLNQLDEETFAALKQQLSQK